jgi:zinc D-Ala-D-Ala carboxypeptidase
MQLSKDFFLREFTSSQTAARLGKEIVPTEAQLNNLQMLCTYGLLITSGLRPPWLNDAIGGSKSSAHLLGLAADIKVVGMSPRTFCLWVQRHIVDEGWPLDQCILEFDQWTHLGMALGKPRGQFLTARKLGGATQYFEGVV